MRKKIAIAVPTAIILLAVGWFVSAKKERLQPLKDGLPVYATGFDISTNIKQSAWDEEVFYKVKINFPATEVISFYDKEFQARGFISYKMAMAQGLGRILIEGLERGKLRLSLQHATSRHGLIKKKPYELCYFSDIGMITRIKTGIKYCWLTVAKENLQDLIRDVRLNKELLFWCWQEQP